MPTEEHTDQAVRYDEDLGCWLVWGTDLAQSALQEPLLTSETLEAATLSFLPADVHEECADLIETTRRWFTLLDGARHHSARRAIQPMFSPRQIRRLHDVIRAIAEEALEEFAHSPGADAIPDLANKVSARAIAHILGFTDTDDEQLHEWARAMAAFFAYSYRRNAAIAAQSALREMREYIKAAPDRGDDVRTTAVGDDRDRLATASMLLFGGLETTASLVGTSLWHMVGNGLQDAVAVSTTGAEAEEIVEHALVSHVPLGHVARMAVDDVELDGCPVAKGDLVLVSLTGRDHLFGDQRNPAHPPEHAEVPRAGHVAFGYGTHYCMGAPLARLAAAEVIRLFARRFPGASVREVDWRGNRTYRGLEHLYLDLPPKGRQA